MELVYKLWHEIIVDWDVLAFFNIAVALVLHNKSWIWTIDRFELP